MLDDASGLLAVKADIGVASVQIGADRERAAVTAMGAR